MNPVKLAQLNGASNEQAKLEVLKDIDISDCVPSGPPAGLQKLYEGFNCLHFAVKGSNLNLINVLLDQGVDLLKQGIYDGNTPLHEAFHHLQISNNDYPVYEGELGKIEIIDTLLSAQVTRNQLLNPQSKKGMTHLHIACIVNHIQAVSFFAQTKEFLDQAINSDAQFFPGYTALHFAVRHSSTESVKMLLRNGADINSKDSKGISPLDLLIQRLLDLKDFMYMGHRIPYHLCQSEIEKLESIAKIFLETIQPDHVNSVSDTGLSIFHLACISADPLICTELLREISSVNKSVKSNSKLWPGWTPLHFAACSSVNMFKVLLQHSADITAKNARGETPLDFFTMRHDPDILCSTLSMRSDIKNILMSDGATNMLDFVLAMNDCDTFSNFLENLRDVNISVPVHSPIWPGYSTLHLASILNEKSKQGFLHTLHSQEEPSSQQVYTCTEEDEKKYWKRINVCLAKSCSLYIKNVDGLCPIHFAFNLRKAQLVDLLLGNCKENVVDSNNVSLLHIACATGRLDVVEDLLDRGADVNIRTRSSFEWYGKRMEKDAKPLFLPVRANSTPLHVAVIFGRCDVARYLLRDNADAYAKDELGLTPIHLSMVAFRNRDDFAMMARIFLFENLGSFHESVSNDGLSHLHVAAYADDEGSIEQLILQGANVNAVLDATVPEFEFDEHPPCELSFLAHYVGMTPLLVAIQRCCSKAVKALIRHGADIFAQSSAGKTPLNSMIDKWTYSFSKHIVQKVKRDQRVVGAIDPSGMTLLHVACASLDFDWAKKLLERGADPNVQIKEDYNCGWDGNTPLMVLLFEATLLINEWPSNLESFVKLLLKYGADITISGKNSSALLYAYTTACPHEYLLDGEGQLNEQQAATMLSIAELLLKSHRSFDVNPMNNRGYSHFHYACSKNEVTIVRKFLDSGIDVNLRTDPFFSEIPGWTPLHFALKHKSGEVARLLIDRGADLKAEDRHGVTPLHVALKSGFLDLQLYEIMFSKGADINAKSILGNERPIDCLLKLSNFTYNQFKFFLANGSTVDITGTGYYDTTIGSIMKNAEPQDRQAIFEELIKICDLKHAVKNGFNAIGNIVSVHQEGQLTLDYYLESIKMFIDMGCQLDQEGQTALHIAVRRWNLEAIEALLLLGANMNIVDHRNEVPFTTRVYRHFGFDDDREFRSLKILAAHIWKMKLVGLDVHRSSEEGMNQTFADFPLELDIKRRCESELKQLERKIIGESLTMKDFLHGSATVNQYPTMSFAQRQTIDDFFHDNLRGHFPELAGLLTMQYRKALQRVQLYEPAKRAMATIFHVELPDLCSENILSNFENEELKEIINVAQKLSLETF